MAIIARLSTLRQTFSGDVVEEPLDDGRFVEIVNRGKDAQYVDGTLVAPELPRGWSDGANYEVRLWKDEQIVRTVWVSHGRSGGAWRLAMAAMAALGVAMDADGKTTEKR